MQQRIFSRYVPRGVATVFELAFLADVQVTCIVYRSGPRAMLSWRTVSGRLPAAQRQQRQVET